MIYLDNAATSYQKPEAVYQAVQEVMHHMGNSGRGAHGASLDASRQIYSARELLAELFHAGDPSRVAFTANSTESLNMAVFGLFGPGDHVITTMLEHNSVLRPLYLLEEAGLELAASATRILKRQSDPIRKELSVPMPPTSPEIWWISDGLGASAER